MKGLRLLVLLFILASFSTVKGQHYTKSDSLIYEAYIKEFANYKDKSFNELIINTAKYFLGKPYVASTLEILDEEKLIINLREFDCTTFVENCIALSATIKFGDLASFENYSRLLTSIRYRDRKIDGYTSRLHYTTDWIYENGKNGVLWNISYETGQRVEKPLNFMSTHPQSYKHLKDNPDNIQKIKEIESSINSRNTYEIIPISAIPTAIEKIHNGDIIAFATSIKGLDYSHMGIAYWNNGKLHFIHASSRMKKVVIESQTLLDYCRNSKNCSGISILRIKELII